jgi:hypothetical protein
MHWAGAMPARCRFLVRSMFSVVGLTLEDISTGALPQVRLEDATRRVWSLAKYRGHGQFLVFLYFNDAAVQACKNIGIPLRILDRVDETFCRCRANVVAIPSSARLFPRSSRPTQRMTPMRIQKGERWHCMNEACAGEIMVLASSQLEGQNPRCSCGSVMKKHYDKPSWSHDDTGALERLAGSLYRKDGK